MHKKLKLIILVGIIVALFLFFRPQTAPVLSIGISTDGRYVISAHATRDANPLRPIGQLVLWDIEKKEKKVLAKNANAYSAVFIPDSHEFMWQDSKNVVHIQNVAGKEIESFPHFQVKTHTITADKAFYLSSNMNENGRIYKGYAEGLVPVYTDGSIPLPLMLSISGNYFLSATETCLLTNRPVAETNLTVNPVNPGPKKGSSYNGVTLWDKHTLKPVARLYGNCGYTTGILSPDGKWVVTGGENSNYYMWEINNLNNRLTLALPRNGVYQELAEKDDKSAPLPKNLKGKPISVGTVAYAFLTEKDFVGLGRSGNKNGEGFKFAAVYTVGEPWIKAYVEIGNDPSISTNYFQRNLSVSSSPQAHILVTGQATGGGINVYRYHPDKMELEKIWVAD